MTLRDEMRSKIFSNNKLKTKTITFFDMEVEIRQPNVAQILDMGKGTDEDDTSSSIVHYLLNFVYVPNTDELVFEKADRDNLMKLPYSKDMQEVVETIKDLAGLEIQEAEGN